MTDVSPERPAVAIAVAAAAVEAVAVHRRTIEMDAFDLDGEIRVVGRLRDDRPWHPDPVLESVHHMELEITVAKAGLVITAAEARMHMFPHAECPQITPVFDGPGGLVGLSIGRGYTRAVQERFSGVKGCAHLAHLSTVLGPVVVQAVTSARARERVATEAALAEGLPGGPGDGATGAGAGWSGPMVNTCHIWAEGGIGQQKIDLGWRPGRDGFPAVPLPEIRRRYRPDATTG
jgi:Protein of unknown function (DUF2889)